MASLTMASTASLRPPSSARLFNTHRMQAPRSARLSVARVQALNKDRVPGVGLMMTPRPYMLSGTDTIEDAATLFLKRGFSHAPVVDAHGKLIGILSETDIMFTTEGGGLTSTYSEDLDQQKVNAKTCAEAMTSDVITVQSSTRFDEAAHEMIVRKVRNYNNPSMLYAVIHCLPVVDDDMSVLGIITRKDILRYNWRHLPFLGN